MHATAGAVKTADNALCTSGRTTYTRASKSSNYGRSTTDEKEAAGAGGEAAEEADATPYGVGGSNEWTDGGRGLNKGSKGCAGAVGLPTWGLSSDNK